MYFLIDRYQLGVIHVHEDPNVLKLLGWIECANYFFVVQVGDAKTLTTCLEGSGMRRLYLNTTGGEMNLYSTRLPHAIFNAVKRMEPSEVVLAEVEKQASFVKDGSPLVFSYEPGAEMPFRHNKQFCPKIRTVPRVTEDESYSFVPSVPVAQQLDQHKEASVVTKTWSVPQVPKAVPAVAPWTKPRAENVYQGNLESVAPKPWEKKKV